MEPRRRDITLADCLPGRHHFGQVPHRKIIILVWLDAVSLSKEFVDLRFHLFHLIRSPCLDGDAPYHPGKGLSEKLLLRGGQRDKDDVVLILAPRCLALGCENPYDRKGNFLDTDDLADRIDPSEQVICHCLSQHTDLRCPIELLFGEWDDLRRGTTL